MNNRIGLGLIGGLSGIIATTGLIAGIILSLNSPSNNNFSGAEPRIQNLRDELPKESSLILPVNGN